jgi:Oxidoreductase family, NAD-binding Rossmann fold
MLPAPLIAALRQSQRARWCYLVLISYWITVALLRGAEPTQLATVAPLREIRVGMIGLDTSHAIAFTKLLNATDPKPEFAGCRVTVAYPKGSADIVSSVERVPKYTEEMRAMGVTIVDSIDHLVSQVDAVLLETNDGRPHLEQILPVLRAGKRTFVDKPMAGSLRDVIAMFDAAREQGVPIFSSSSLRYAEGPMGVRAGKIGKVLACDTYSPCYLETTHPDLFWYGIHGVESLYTVMGPGCQQVSRVHTSDADMVVGIWEGGRIGSFRGMRTGKLGYGGTAFGTEGNTDLGGYSGYDPLVVEIVKFFRGGPPPVSAEETIELFAFMEAADQSKRNGGAPVTLAEVMAKARASLANGSGM